MFGVRPPGRSRPHRPQPPRAPPTPCNTTPAKSIASPLLPPYHGRHARAVSTNPSTGETPVIRDCLQTFRHPRDLLFRMLHQDRIPLPLRRQPPHPLVDVIPAARLGDAVAVQERPVRRP